MLRLESELNTVVSEIRKRKAKRVILQEPEGLKHKALEIAQWIEQHTHAECITLVDPVFGACDLAENERKQFHADLIVHLGHTQFVKNDNGKTLYVPLQYEVEHSSFEPLLQQLVNELREKKIQSIAVAGSIQFQTHIQWIKRELAQKKIQVHTCEGRQTQAGQVLGCDALGVQKALQNAQATLYVGDGNFHSLAIQLTSEKPLIVLNPLNETLQWNEGEQEKYRKQRYAIMGKAMNAQKFGILVSSKEGQFRLDYALRLKKLIEHQGKQAYVFASDLQLPEYFIGMNMDCFVCTACPRIPLEDWKKWVKPIINGMELEIVLGLKKMSEYTFNELI